MKISTKGRYAVRLMLDIAQNSDGKNISLKDVSKRQGISLKYLEQIVNALSKAGLLISQRGSQGGYRLTKTPEEYTIGEILRVTEGDLAPVACLEAGADKCERVDICPTIGLWRGLHKAINEYLDGVTISDLTASVKKNGGDFCYCI